MTEQGGGVEGSELGGFAVTQMKLWNDYQDATSIFEHHLGDKSRPDPGRPLTK